MNNRHLLLPSNDGNRRTIHCTTAKLQHGQRGFRAASLEGCSPRHQLLDDVQIHNAVFPVGGIEYRQVRR